MENKKIKIGLIGLGTVGSGVFKTLQNFKNVEVVKIAVHKQIVHTQEPNLQSVKAVVNGTTKRIRVCTSCLKAGKVQKAM